MRRRGRLRRRRALLALFAAGARLGLGLLATGCYTTRVRTDPSAALAEPVGTARVTRTNGATLAVIWPAVRADSLVGWSAAAGDSLPIAIPLAEVRSVEMRELNPVNSLHLFGLVAAAAAGAIYLYTTSLPRPVY